MPTVNEKKKMTMQLLKETTREKHCPSIFQVSNHGQKFVARTLNGCSCHNHVDGGQKPLVKLRKEVRLRNVWSRIYSYSIFMT